MPVRQTIETGQAPVKVFTDEVEAGARSQLENVSKLPIVFHHVAAMPDVHAGIGATVGWQMGSLGGGNHFIAGLEAQTHGVECRKDSGVLDEIPGAYKDIDQVMADQTDLVEIVYTLKQVVCVKG
jgi:RNA-splicing ligase RtcB